MKLFEIFDAEYMIASTGPKKWSVAKFAGHDQPENVYAVAETKPGTFWTDSPGFSKVGQNVKTIRLVKQFIADGQPKMVCYVYDDDTGTAVKHQFGDTSE